MKFMSRYVVGVMFLSFLATLAAHSHHRGMPRFTTPHHDRGDVFVRPVEEATTVFYSGRYHPEKQPADDSKWIPIGKPQCVRIQNKGKTILIYQSCVQPAKVSGADRFSLTLEVRRETHPARVQSVQKLSVRSRNHHSVIYAAVDGAVVEIHADRKTSHCVKPKPKRKMKEQHNSRKRAAASRDAKGSSHRRCKVSHSKKESNHVR